MSISGGLQEENRFTGQLFWNQVRKPEKLLDESILYKEGEAAAVNKQVSILRKAAVDLLSPAVRLFEHLL